MNKVALLDDAITSKKLIEKMFAAVFISMTSLV